MPLNFPPPLFKNSAIPYIASIVHVFVYGMQRLISFLFLSFFLFFFAL